MFKELGSKTNDVRAIGHRVVHGGEKYRESIIATEEVLRDVESVSSFAPLHNPANLLGVRACMEILPNVPNVLVFDTAFHSTIPAHAYLYAIPLSDYQEHGIRRYGFHGTSYSYVAKKTVELYNERKNKNIKLTDLRMVIMHLGNGASICAVDKGKSIDTSMGMTPLEGLVMGTRSGDIDVGAVAYLASVKDWSIEQTLAYLNNDCGIKGLGGTGSDMRKLIAEMDKSEQAKVAFDAYIHRLVKYLGGYIAIMGGVDAIVFTGGVGTNQAIVRERVMEYFKYLATPPQVFVIPTNEELEIATETKKLIDNK